MNTDLIFSPCSLLDLLVTLLPGGPEMEEYDPCLFGSQVHHHRALSDSAGVGTM